MNPKVVKQIEKLQSDLNAETHAAKAAQKVRDASHHTLFKQFQLFPYAHPWTKTEDVEVIFAEVCRHPEAKGKNWRSDFGPGAKPISFIELMQPKMEEFRQVRETARKAWQTVTETETKIAELESEVLSEFTDSFNSRISAMHEFLVRVFTPFCMAQQNWEVEQQLETLIGNATRYQTLLLDRKYGSQGKTASGRVSSMMCALTKLAEREADDLAAITITTDKN
jgi:hypothetical protein